MISGRKILARLSDVFVGSSCTEVLRFDTGSWRFVFGGATLDVSCPWRIVANGRVALGYDDHAQQFGLPAPVDGVQEARRLLANRIRSIRVRERTADLVINVEDNVALEVFNSSSGYEGWECSSNDGLLAIGLGGGNSQVWLTDLTDAENTLTERIPILLPKSACLVLYDLLRRSSGAWRETNPTDESPSPMLVVADEHAHRQALWCLEGAIERTVHEVMATDSPALVTEAKRLMSTRR